MFNFRSPPAAVAPSSTPLASAPAVRDWAQCLTETDVLTAHRQVCDLLERQLGSMAGSHAAPVGAVLELHEISRPWQDTLASQFCSPARLLPQQDESLWEALCRYDHLFLRAYAAALPINAAGELYPLRDPGGLILGRMMHLLLEEATWRFCRYLPCSEASWRSAHWLLQQAEEQALLSAPSVLFAAVAHTAPVTMLSLYLQLILLDLAWRHNLSRGEVNATLAWLAEHAGLIEWAGKAGGHDSFWIDLDQPRGALSLRPTGSHRCRSLSTRAVCQALSAQAGLPAGLSARLVRAWTLPSPVRDAPRQAGVGEVDLVCGFDAVMALLQDRQTDAGIHAGDLSDMRLYGITQSQRSRLREASSSGVNGGRGAAPVKVSHRWRLVDSSDSGIGVCLPLEATAGVGIGGMVAVRRRVEDGWRAGIIRRLRREGAGSLLLGIEWLAEQSQPVTLRPVKGLQGGEGVSALYVPPEPGRQGGASLLLPLRAYAASQHWVLQLERRHSRIHLLKVLSGGADWCRCDMAVEPEEDVRRPV